MPAGLLDTRCQRTLEDIVCISQRIRLYARSRDDNGDVLAVENFRADIETIRRSAETIHEAFTLQDRNLDETLFTWVCGGGLLQCLDRLKEMEGILDLNHQVQSQVAAIPPQPLTRAIIFINQQKETFRFLLDQKLSDYTAHPNQSSIALQSLRSSGEVHNDMEESTMASIAVVAHKQFIRQKLDEISRWLTASDCTEKHVEMLQLRQIGTCTWFPKTAAYKVWRTGKSTFLWMCGQAGCGKSVTVASTLEHLKSTLGPGEALVYFYCDFRNERSASATEVIRALLSQLFRHLCAFRVDPGALPNWILEQKSESGALLLEDLDRLASWVCRAASRFSHKPIIVIDALDECANVKQLLGALTMLIQADVVRLLVTSRPEEVISQHLGRYPLLSFQEMDKELAGDINVHITRELDSYVELRFADADIKNEIRVKLCHKAEGRFRWIQCQLDMFKRCSSKQELQQVLDDLPVELGATYERILGRIDERRSEGKVARRSLAWLVVALSPLRLAQLVEGLALDTRPRGNDSETHSMGHALVDALSSLVTYNKATDEVALSHYTVKEYLTSRTALPMYRIIAREAHAEVIQMCMLFITTLLQKWRFRAKGVLSESFPMLHYVFVTGFDHLAHIDLDPGSTDILDVLLSFASDVQHHPSHWDLLCELREEDPRRLYPPWPSSRHDLVLYILIAYSSTSLLQSFLQSRPFAPRVGTNPLVYAADLYKTNHGLMLLASGANVNEPGLIVDDSRYALPLEVAVDLGNDVLVSELLQKGSVVPSTLISTAVYTPWCTGRVLVHLMHTDAFMEWARKMENENLYRRVFNSARPNAGDPTQAERDHVALARRLREVGQNLASDSPLGVVLIERALHAANVSMLEYLLPPDQPPPNRFLFTACTGNTFETVSVVRLLLRKGVNVRAVSDGDRDTALHLAARCPWEPRALELTKILLNAGCRPATQNRRGETPMTIAMRRGYLTVMEHLPFPSSYIPSHALLRAIQQRVLPVIEFLIRMGANVHARTSSGKTIFHLILMARRSADIETWIEAEMWNKAEMWNDRGMRMTRRRVRRVIKHPISLASQSNDYHEGQCLELCRLFIEVGCDPTSSDATAGGSVLELAVNRGYTSVVEYLLSRGALFPSDIFPTSVKTGLNCEMAEFLIGKGADVHPKTGEGDNVLHLAVTMVAEPQCLGLVKIFISAGCDPTSSSAQGRSVLQLAIHREYDSVVEYLLSLGCPIPPGILSVPAAWWSGSYLRAAQVLLQKGTDMLCKTGDRDTSLHLAVTKFCEMQHLYLVKNFDEVGCDPSSRDRNGRSASEIAINHGYSALVEYLLSCGVQHLQAPIILLTAMQYDFALGGMEHLVQNGTIEPHLHFTTNGGAPALHLMASRFPELICTRLVMSCVEAGWNPNACNSESTTILTAAIERGYTSVVELLLSYDVPLPPDILVIALWFRSSPRVVEALVHQGANVYVTSSNGITLFHVARALYVDPHRQQIIGILRNAYLTSVTG